MHSSFALLALLAAPILASPVAYPMPTPAPSPKEVNAALARRATTCTFSGAQYASAIKSKASCGTIYLESLAVPAGVTLDMTDLEDDTVIIFKGTTTFAFEEWEGPLFAVSGSGITVSGGGSAILDGKGASYWDGEGSDGGVTKPKFFQAHNLDTNSLIEQITILNPPVQVFSIDDCTDVEFAYITIDATAGTTSGLAFNTDGFDIGSSDSVTIEYATVYNQDDCVAINSGTNIIFRNGYCSGGHGLSIGSVGGRDNNVVDTVSFTTTTVIDSVQAIRIKTISGDTGSVANVEYDDITMSGITKYGILIEQNYDGGDLDGTATTGIPITGLIIKNIVGTGAVSSSGYDVVIVCGGSSSCTGWTWSSVAVTGGKKYASCSNVPSVAACS